MSDSHRRIVVGWDRQGRSVVVADGPPRAGMVRPNGAEVHEIWRQESLPANPRAIRAATDDGAMRPLPPPEGVSVRIFTLPPDDPGAAGAVSKQDLEKTFGAGNVGASTTGRLLTRTASVYVAAMLSGSAYLVLESSEVLLGPGDCFVLPGALHTWRNPFEETAVMMSTVFPLAERP